MLALDQGGQHIYGDAADIRFLDYNNIGAPDLNDRAALNTAAEAVIANSPETGNTILYNSFVHLDWRP